MACALSVARVEGVCERGENLLLLLLLCCSAVIIKALS
jgi:hypothetical protein